jgi:hypothetical protein
MNQIGAAMFTFLDRLISPVCFVALLLSLSTVLVWTGIIVR